MENATWYEPSWESVRKHTLPAWAEVTWELGGEPSIAEWFGHNPYAKASFGRAEPCMNN